MRKIILVILIALFSMSLFAQNKKVVGITILNGKNTKFKTAVIEALKTSNPEISFKLFNFKSASDIKKNSYNAVIVFDQLEAWTLFNRKLKSVSKKLDPKKTIYYITAGNPDWNWKKEGVITISSASKDDSVGVAKNKINKQLQIILNR